MKKFIKFIGYPITLIIGIVVGFTVCLEVAKKFGINIHEDKDDDEYYDYDDLECVPHINGVPLSGKEDVCVVTPGVDYPEFDADDEDLYI